MNDPSGNKSLKEQQYANQGNFNHRVYLHATFRQNPYPWPLWIFDQIPKDAPAKVLELGSGTGMLWMANAMVKRIPPEWDITLSDFSPGMLNDARKNVGALADELTFAVIDAEHIPHPDETFDIVIANHMLYHVADRPRAFAEIQRVLKPGGALYASTVGLNNMAEMKQLVQEFNPASPMDLVLGGIEAGFSLENGTKQLEPFFADIRIVQYDDALIVTEVEPLVQYVFSCNGLVEQLEVLPCDQLDAFRDFVAEKMSRTGSIFISKESGLFICRKANDKAAGRLG